MPATLRQQFHAALAICALACATARAADPATEKTQALQQLRAAITNNITTPCGIKPRQSVEIKVLLQDNGYVQSLALAHSSGAPDFDAALMTAIAGAQPFNLPRDEGMRKELRNLNLKFDAASMPIPPCNAKR